MDPPAAFPLHLPGDAARPFGSEEVTRRLVALAGVEAGSRVLELGCGTGRASLWLAREVRCAVVAADSDPGALDTLRERVRTLGLGDRLEVRQLEPGGLPAGLGPFNAVLVQGRILWPLAEAAGKLRGLLAPRGRLALTYVARVGRVPARAALDYWQQRLGEPLRLPQELLGVVERAGYEPEALETLADAELDAFYRELEAHLAGVPEPHASALRTEVALHREANGKTRVSYALLVARRREPGEAPPPARDRG